MGNKENKLSKDEIDPKYLGTSKNKSQTKKMVLNQQNKKQFYEIQKIFIINKSQDILMVLHKTKQKENRMLKSEIFKIYDFNTFKHKQDLEQVHQNKNLQKEWTIEMEYLQLEQRMIIKMQQRFALYAYEDDLQIYTLIKDLIFNELNSVIYLKHQYLLFINNRFYERHLVTKNEDQRTILKQLEYNSFNCTSAVKSSFYRNRFFSLNLKEMPVNVFKGPEPPILEIALNRVFLTKQFSKIKQTILFKLTLENFEKLVLYEYAKYKLLLYNYKELEFHILNTKHLTVVQFTMKYDVMKCYAKQFLLGFNRKNFILDQLQFRQDTLCRCLLVFYFCNGRIILFNDAFPLNLYRLAKKLFKLDFSKKGSKQKEQNPPQQSQKVQYSIQ